MDIRDSTRIATLPDDLKAIADEMLQSKFGLAKKGEVVEKPKPKPKKKKNPITDGYGSPDEVKAPTYIDPRLVYNLEEAYHHARMGGGRPDTVYMHPRMEAALYRDVKARGFMSHDMDSRTTTVMGMKLKVDSRLQEDRIVLVDGFRNRIEYDTNKPRTRMMDYGF